MMLAVTMQRKASINTACGTPIEALSAPTARLNTSWYAWATAPGSESIIPTVMIIETPFPIPRWVICSPSQVRIIQPVVSNITLTMKNTGIFPAIMILPNCPLSKPWNIVSGL